MKYFKVKAVMPAESSRLETFYALLRMAVQNAKDQRQRERYLSDMETNRMNPNERGLRTKTSSVLKSSSLRSKKFLCDRHGNCAKRAYWKAGVHKPLNEYLEISDNTDERDKSVTPNTSNERNGNAYTGQFYNPGKELTRFYFPNADFTEINKLLGKKKISKKQFYSSFRRFKRSLNAVKKVSSGATANNGEFKNSKDGGQFKEQELRQYCLTHKCEIKVDKKRAKFQDRQALDSERGLTKQNDRSAFSKLLKQIRGYGRKRMTAVNLNNKKHNAEHLPIKRANPFCPPWGCRRRRNEILTQTNGLKDISREKILKSISGAVNVKTGVNARDILSEPVRHKNHSFFRKLRLSPFCPYRGCRG